MEVNIRIAGAAGQGIQTAAGLLGKALTRSNLFAYAYTDAESRIRGGLNFTHIRCSREPLAGVTNRIDILVALSKEALSAFEELMTEKSLVVAPQSWPHPHRVPAAIGKLAEQAGSEAVSGTVSIATAWKILGQAPGILETLIREHFASKKNVLAQNLKALNLVFDSSQQIPGAAYFHLPAASSTGTGRMWISGHEAVSLGAVAGGVTFVTGYPMSPATSILINMAQWHRQLEVIVEQAEDEIAAINMVAGASYAGARAMTATSGGGFSLMVEGLSLLGMIEYPAVIVLAQRPGPATGLPTRTAQGDLNFVRHAGHGSFPRVIIAPGNISECFDMTALAFDIAEQYQVPVFVMTDQLLQDSQTTMAPFAVGHLPKRRHIMSPEALTSLTGYRRYARTESGVSPLAAPGDSRHVVVVDSDEHDEAGHITESARIADEMAQKRLQKGKTLMEASWKNRLVGPVDGRPLVVGWGSSLETLKEAVSRLNAEGLKVAHFHLSWLWPVQEQMIRQPVQAASRLIVVDHSVDGGLGAYLREVALRAPDAVISRRDGRPFSVDELYGKLRAEVIE